ncbi:efflux RND transporter periplasmic adaptor subunit [Taibaiella koreensis]|uniref:efflux RND transporter periplasmic adaptor subunit n=1 Tax=Taibaiella koreensis TaxID=1268548 RepID=UPI000E59AB1F|nr:efflux RND transporter periplasmic adaptor subunit [Taibaiella koreensis]
MKTFPIILLIASLTFLCSCGSRQAAPAAKETTTEAGETHGESNIVSVSAEQIRTAGIVSATLEHKNLGSSIKVTGRLEVPAQNKAAVTSLYSGILKTLLVLPGSEVRKGQAIATITNTELAGLQQNLISVNAQLQLAELEYTRQKELVAGNAAPLKNLQRAQAERNSLKAQQAALKKQLATLGIGTASLNSGAISSTLTLTAPISGTISTVNAEIGSKVDAATPVATIVNNSQLHLDLYVYEKDLPLVQKGQTIHFTLTNAPGKEHDARIFSIGTAFADQSKAVPVHAEVSGDKTGLIEGMNVTAVISIGNTTAPAVPTEAIVSNAGKDYIFIRTDKEEHGHAEKTADGDHEETRFERIQVVRGVSDLGYTEIQPVADLPHDAQVVVKGAFFVMARMTNTGEHEH